ncbi:AtpZ/AtpI family protein [Aneurinibacillus sp. Ricciae_BoGa-3]|uniref:AtpZ/AtpI family protein n=1 Tax=Aneurinibacillus sp. Ricciae_BoGa-3 TaxID=3022697 RepID=UPI0023409F2F|nr:AtpZ/AtpI family protein [Aneurinibacillus sp. Ricciae_BoGa-3]WCK54350.1 AtpZ/AtpI family protein [Aneurinibacillus sp. Ricciae_BoGa-3]
MNQNKNGPMRAFALVGTIGIEMAISVLCGFWAGRWLDGWLHTAPWFLLAGILLGLALGITGILFLIKQFFGE